ncbi:MAG TPA: DHH family phosphoesterase [Candidatus Gastranaerophilales bacterium]|nr:DHH family phosphoesterase [Candidatus Gastranaerophilales bacterium]
MINKIAFNQYMQQKSNSINNNNNKVYTETQLDTFCVKQQPQAISFGNNNFSYQQNKNVIHLISFTGLNDPSKNEPIGLQFKIRGVKANQTNKIENDTHKKIYKTTKQGVKNLNSNYSVNNLAKSDWKDGQLLEWDTVLRFENQKQVPVMEIYDQNQGESGSTTVLGRMPKEIYKHLRPYLKTERENFRLELSNVVAGTSKAASTIGLRANLIYTGKDAEKREKIEEVFDKILNAPDCKDTAMLYQPKTSPEEVLNLILGYEKKVNGSESAKKMQTAINNIQKEIEDPENKSILLIGHSKPDGDTIGCVLGLKNAIGLKYPEKVVDCAIDDKIPGLFRHKIPGIDGEIKRPFNSNKIENITQEIAKFKKKNTLEDKNVKTEIEILEDEKNELAKIKGSEPELKPNKKYDLVILMDIPTPTRFTSEFKPYIENAKKVIYIDHHPHRLKEWQNAKEKNGLDVEKIHENGLSWIADSVPAAAQMVGILAAKFLPALNDIGNNKVEANDVYKDTQNIDKLRAFVASTVAGISTDTGSFTRTANLLPEHMDVPVQQRPNFMPEGFSKWLMGLTEGIEGNINKKWLREEINYDIEDTKIPDLPLSARQKMLEYSLKGKSLPERKLVIPQKNNMAQVSKPVDKKLGLGIVAVNYDEMFDVWKLARNSEKLEGKKPETTLIDVQNAFKYSEVINTMRSNPLIHGEHTQDELNWREEIEKKALENYKSDFDGDRIAILIMQDKKAGSLEEKLEIADQNGLRISFRSQNGTNHAEILSFLFNGGGHGGASGGRVDLPGIEIDTTLSVKINDQKENDPKKILEALNRKYEILNDKKLTQKEKAQKAPKFELVEDKAGKSAPELITDIVKEIRQEQLNAQNIIPQSPQSKHNPANAINKNPLITIPIDLAVRKTGILPSKTEPNKDFKENLSKIKEINRFNINISAKRIESLSNYLKDKMVGFIVPSYEVEGKKKGGYQWFERGLENMIKGSRKPNLPKEEYKDTSKELFGLLSLYDNYWKSAEFKTYLGSLKESSTINKDQSFAIDATIQAIDELNHPDSKKLSFGAIEEVTMRKAFFSPMKAMPEIYEKCAYSGEKLERGEVPDKIKVSIEHVVPRSWVNKPLNDDGNYIMTSISTNNERSGKPLIGFLKGW